MSELLVNAEGGLTTAGYAVTIVVGIVLFLTAVFFASKSSSQKRMSTKQLVFCAAALALAYLTSYIKLFEMPWGGSVTLFSMLFIVLIANWYGVKTGILVGFAYGIIQFIQEPYVLTFFQVCCDYILAFAALGVAGFFAKSKYGIRSGKGIHNRGTGKRRIPCHRRVSVLDGLYAGQFPEGARKSVSDPL